MEFAFWRWIRWAPLFRRCLTPSRRLQLENPVSVVGFDGDPTVKVDSAQFQTLSDPQKRNGGRDIGKTRLTACLSIWTTVGLMGHVRFSLCGCRISVLSPVLDSSRGIDCEKRQKFMRFAICYEGRRRVGPDRGKRGCRVLPPLVSYVGSEAIFGLVSVRRLRIWAKR